jgi:hypothetical protein
MKLTRFLGGIAIFAAASALVSCQKDETSSPTVPQVENNARVSGVVADDPAKVAKVPMIVSSGFLQSRISNEPIYDAKGKPDNTAPSVSITSPSASSIVSGTIQVKANASDNVAVTLVSLSVNGTLVTTSTTAPYSLPWNSSSLPNGSHTLTITAKDGAGNTKSASIQVTNSNTTTGGDVTNPTVSITSPANGASVSGTVSITANAGDNVGVASVSYSVDGAVIGTATSSPYSFSWNSASVASGIHNITATATDAAGNSASNTIQVTVNTTVLPPASIPSSFQLLTPTPGNQGGEGSCVAFAVGYGARSIEQFYRTNASAYTQETNIFSPEYVYNQTKFSDCASGTAFTIVLDLIKNQGISSWQSMPYSDVNGCSTQPNATQVANASAYKISSYVTIPNTDQMAIKTMIASKHPVITNIIADNSFMNAGPGFVCSSYSGAGSLPHAILICGYDDAKHAYKIMNSFGTGWGDAGFSWIDYDFFTQKSAYYTYVMQ